MFPPWQISRHAWQQLPLNSRKQRYNSCMKFLRVIGCQRHSNRTGIIYNLCSGRCNSTTCKPFPLPPLLSSLTLRSPTSLQRRQRRHYRFALLLFFS
ncbi:hypothetical protein CEXT_213161 [Caerostris extrusa]|uniref:Uncharacterized protein n=1 Tax=Caerostris extrusa TaxID=172846 RepID=A0AAV4PXY8_CAEEX|nr:hypothetical protein CEXT_213161 [Caerostris extrusa]